jgi:uncharacterized protein YcfJ
MKTTFKQLLVIAALALAGQVSGQASGQVILYEQTEFAGRSLTVVEPLEDFRRSDFNDSAHSVMVIGLPWQLCEDFRFQGHCVVLRPGRYPSLVAMGLSGRISSARAADGQSRIDNVMPMPMPMPMPAQGEQGTRGAQVIFYERAEFKGRSFTADTQVGDFRRTGFNDQASSAVVMGGRWEACADTEFRGRCVILRSGRYPSLTAMGMDNMISSVRTIRRDAQVTEDRYAPTPIAVYDNRRQNDERLYEVGVTSVKAVVGRDEQRCWVEQQPVVQNQGSASANANANPNVGGALVGALLGGILGHQVGAGTGKDLATVGGVIAGGVIGSNVGRDANAQAAPAQNIQRCNNASQAAPAYWDVTYSFRGQVHRVQMATRPGATLTVNEQGEPRS